MFDGELRATECELLSRRIDRDENLRARWSRYALIGAAMRSEPVATARSGFARRVSAALRGSEDQPRLARGRKMLLSAALFTLGIVGFLIKRNLITVFMSIELMLNAVNLSFVTFAHQWHAVKGQIFVFFVMMVAAAEAAVGLAIIIAVFRARATLAVDRIDLMKL